MELWIWLIGSTMGIYLYYDKATNDKQLELIRGGQDREQSREDSKTD
jgi:hypothetical protein